MQLKHSYVPPFGEMLRNQVLGGFVIRWSWLATNGCFGCGCHPEAGPGAILQVCCRRYKEANMLLLSSDSNYM
jgi:hypothetical protein